MKQIVKSLHTLLFIQAKRFVFFVLFCIVSGSIVAPVCTYAQTNDLLDKVYELPQDWGYVSDADAEDMLDTKISLSLSSGVGLKESVVVKTSRFMLRVAVVLGIAMVLYSGIKIALSVGDEGKFKEALKHLGIVLLGVFLALMSIAIVYIIISITRTNLDVV